MNERINQKCYGRQYNEYEAIRGMKKVKGPNQNET